MSPVHLCSPVVRRIGIICRQPLSLAHMCPAEEHQYGEERGDPSSLDLAYVRASAGRRGRNVGAEQAGLSVAFYTASVRRPCVLHLPEGTPTGTPSDRPSSWCRPSCPVELGPLGRREIPIADNLEIRRDLTCSGGSSSDSPLEEDGFELAVPSRRERVWGATPGKHRRPRT